MALKIFFAIKWSEDIEFVGVRKDLDQIHKLEDVKSIVCTSFGLPADRDFWVFRKGVFDISSIQL